MREGYPAHPFAELFPLHDGPPLVELRNDIEKYGQREDIILYEGQVLDGRRRQACVIELDKEPRYRNFRGNEAEALAYAISANLKRRHLGETERAMVAAKIAKLPVGRPTVLEPKSSGKNGKVEAKSEEIPEKTGGQEISGIPLISSNGDQPLSQKQVAELMGVSLDSLKRCKAVLEHAPDLQPAVIAGEMSIGAAYEEARKRKKANGKRRKPSANGQVEKDDADANGQLLDSLKQPVPPGLIPVFSRAKDFRAIINGINQLKRLAKEISESRGGRQLRLQAFEVDMNNAKRTVEFDIPYAVCPVCKGDAKSRKPKCPCQDKGWLTKSSYECCLPKEYKE